MSGTEMSGTRALEDFCRDTRDILNSDIGPQGQERVRQRLLPLLSNRPFLETFAGPGAAPGGHRLFTDPDLGFTVVVYIGKAGRGESPPHDHGDDWAIYGQSALYTDMRDFRVVAGDRHDLTAELEETSAYRLNPGDARLYFVGDIHSINPVEHCCYVRIAGSPADHFTPVARMSEAKQKIWGPAVTERPAPAQASPETVEA